MLMALSCLHARGGWGLYNWGEVENVSGAMKTLFLLRHAKSAWDNPELEDHDRVLNERGRQNAEQMGQYMKKAGYRPDLILCSTAQRTRETLAAVLRFLPDVTDIHYERQLYLAHPQAMFLRLMELPDDVPSVLMVAHSPGTEQLALALAREDGDGAERGVRRQIDEKYPTGALVVLKLPIERWADLAPGTATLEAFVRPRDL